LRAPLCPRFDKSSSTHRATFFIGHAHNQRDPNDMPWNTPSQDLSRPILALPQLPVRIGMKEQAMER